MASPARTVAFDTLLRVEQGAFASELLHRATLGPKDAALAHELVLGALRHQAQLDFLIRHFSGKTAKLDPEVRIALRLAIYQLRYLERIPAHAAVAESVELVKRARKRSAAGFVNAVLRKVGRQPVPWPDRATALSMPAWLLESWDREGLPADLIAGEFLKTPATYVRNPPSEAAVQLTPTDVEGAFQVVSGDPRGLQIQDVGSQSIVPLLDLHAGQTFLDLCAAPGNKTAQALESGVVAVACDLYWHRLKDVQGCSRVVLDARQPLPFRTQFDRVLVDAPCSGTGTLGRNPEIRWRLKPSDIAELAEKQRVLLTQALAYRKPGGILVYSTCSLERQENEDVVSAVLEGHPGLQVRTQIRRVPGLQPGDGFFAAVLTSD